MGSKLPYLPTPGTIPKVLDKIVEARVPDRFTLDFLGTKLGFKGGNARPIIPFLKRLGFLRDDGSTTEIYTRFRMESERGKAMAEAMQTGFSEIFERNEYAYDLDRKNLKDLVYSITGAEKGNSASECIVSSFMNLLDYADFESEDEEGSKPLEDDGSKQIERVYEGERQENHYRSDRTLSLGYNININLPETTNVDVYNAIFEAIDKKLIK
ncbi:DUF5343 domain-containing protein [Jannaschia ovalis]|uniref:DUF5343 domain-containing protein n=1 Tax=Jannaschia ovalis TaxID=3038773 RepID=A0ABY8L923_9RHOB|nr:DUF5343 domain-containing protein [Jannaschia sp. GRR-S6-38]WGH77862.1 DUF5343 domain-containing protein [Jannaschia sp. GRR-S6-38]